MIDEIVDRAIDNSMQAMFPNGAGRAPHTRVKHHLETVAQIAFRQGRDHVLLGLMTVQDVAEHFRISERRARALIANRHDRFGVGMQFGGRGQWLIHRDELPQLQPYPRHQIP